MWIYRQKTGELLDDSGSLIATGYAGREEGKNNPDMQNVKGIGPLPVGEYTIGSPVDDPVVGKYAMRLAPAVTNQMFGRASFLIHGDSYEHPGLASHGCIVMPRAIREAVWNSGDHWLRVESGL